MVDAAETETQMNMESENGQRITHVTLDSTHTLGPDDNEDAGASAVSPDEKKVSQGPDVDIICDQCHSDYIAMIKAKDEQITSLQKQLGNTERKLLKYQAYNENLQSEISKLSAELHEYRQAEKRSKNEAAVAVACTSQSQTEESSEKPMPKWITEENPSCQSIADSLKEAAEAALGEQEEDKSIIQNTAPSHTQENSSEGSDYVFDEASGLYYHPATGYYWDPNSSLFYDYTSGTYYQFDEASGQYTFHSQVKAEGNLAEASSSTSSQVLRAMKKDAIERKRRKIRKRKENSPSTKELKKKKIASKKDSNEFPRNVDDEEKSDNTETGVHQDNISPDNEKITRESSNTSSDDESDSGSLATGESELESGELSASSDSDLELVAVERQPQMYIAGEGTSDNAPITFGSSEDISDTYPSCIRAIVTESECLSVGTLFLITCMGGTIGRLKNKGHVIQIPDENVSKEHAQIKYDYEDSSYKISDLGSQNGTWLNEEMLSKCSGDRPLSHGDELHFCGTRLTCHIHKGSETCDDCEPGQIQAKLKASQTVFNDHVVVTKAERQRNRRSELKKIKKKYGLQNSHFEEPGSVLPPGQYTDKAQLRRQTVGSDVEGAKAERPASVHQPVSSTNKGRQLLAKMGWQEGQGLGKDNMGIAEPINVELRVNASAGLGSASNVALSLDNVHNSGKAKRWAQARNRFDKLPGPAQNMEESLTSPIQHLAASRLKQDLGPGVPNLASPASKSVEGGQQPKSRKPVIKWHKGEVQYSGDATSSPVQVVQNDPKQDSSIT